MRWLLALWLALGFTLAFAHRPLYNTLWLLLLWVWALYVLLGLALLRALFRFPRRTALAYAATTLAGSCLLWLGHGLLASWGERPYLAWRAAHYWPRYRAVVTDVLRGSVRADPRVRWRERNGVDFMIDTGPPVRIAFLQPDALLDNWEGIVYDPTGRVATAVGYRDGIPDEYTAAPDVVRLFGGDLLWCQPLEPHYFLCRFT